MSRAKRLSRVASQLERESEAVGAELRRLQTDLDQQLEQLERLQDYKKSYQDRLLGTQHCSALSLTNFAQFLTRLDHAVSHQLMTVARSRQSLECKRSEWIAAHLRVRAVEQVAVRWRHDEQTRSEKMEQRSNDDLSMTRFLAERKQ